MIKIIIAFTFASFFSSVNAQTQTNTNKQISGQVIGKPVITDTILFTYGAIDKKYYKQQLKYASLKSNRYVMQNTLTYPVMFKIAFTSEKGIIIWRAGDYFIDSSTNRIKTDDKYDNCNEVNGATADEYQSKFIPFVTKGTSYDCKSNYLSDLFYDSNHKADSLILNYIIVYPNSYIALWKLIERFSRYGQSSIR